MFHKRVFRFPGPLIPDADHPPRILVRRGFFSASVIWETGRLHPTHPAYAAFKERLEAAGMIHTIEAWLAARRDQFKLRPILGGSVRWGGVRGLPREFAEPLARLVGTFFAQAVARPLGNERIILAPATPPLDATPMPVVLRDAEGGFEQRLLCPECGFDYVHLCEHDVQLDRDSTRVRGHVICLPGWCEHGHRFTLCLGFHKGMTETWAEARTGPALEGEPTEWEASPEITLTPAPR